MSLSRGRKFTGEWIVGIHATGSKHINQGKEYICPVVRSVGYDPIGQIHLGPFYEVEAGTVGACSEVNDTAGIAIFAGDILESRASENPEDWRRWVVEYEDGAFGFRTKAGKRKTGNLWDLLCEDNVHFYGLVIVGNIHDSPELMEG